MGASTQAILFCGAMSKDFHIWHNMEEDHGEKAEEKKLKFGTIRDGETTGYYLALNGSILEVDAGTAIHLDLSHFTVPQQWRDTFMEFADSINLPLTENEPRWYLACETDRDY